MTPVFPCRPMLYPLLALALAGPAPAQEAPPAEDMDPSRETDISEENYRRFMELDDRQLERPAFPAANLQPGSALQKMNQLPESSQKHLRNQLRGIILTRGPWTPAERDAPYVFAPSAAARKDPELLRREAEAWAELVGEYHDREEAILAGRQARQGAVAGNPGEPGRPDEPGDPGNPALRDAAGQAAPGGPRSTGGMTPPGAQATADGDDGQGSAQGQAANGSDGQNDGERRRAPEFTERERPEATRRPETPAPGTTDTARSETPSNDGVEESASALLRARGLVDGSAAPPAAPDPPRGADTGNPGRWGEDVDRLPPEPSTETESASRPGLASPPGTPEPVQAPPSPEDVLTVEELRRVRGVTAPEEAEAAVFEVFERDEAEPEDPDAPSGEDGDG